MAAFIAKQMVGDQLKSVKGALGDKEDGGEKASEEGEDPEVAEARREMEEKRKEKHRKMEVEREEMRQQIRDKYGLKKKEIVAEPEAEGRVGRRKKTPAELAAENNPNDSDDEEFANDASGSRVLGACSFLHLN
ncbi:complexin-like isoform X2 [Pomacea canaliculata]|uniref:complexin-like isoform X2 n=1 Tax=Pomacea canaliculata TaxID=400727 RepID=UPI000D72A5BF|nr:complexin-like isoform X2 [Pomacea canaliculata]